MSGRCAALLACLLLAGCMGLDEADRSATQALEASGFSNVIITDRAIILGCDQNDLYRKRWTGINQSGRQVHGQVCAGWFFKGWTVRIER